MTKETVSRVVDAGVVRWSPCRKAPDTEYTRGCDISHHRFHHSRFILARCLCSATHGQVHASLCTCARSLFTHKKTQDVGAHLTGEILRSKFQNQERKTRSMSVMEPTDMVRGGGTTERAHSADERPDDADATERRQHEGEKRRSTVTCSRATSCDCSGHPTFEHRTAAGTTSSSMQTELAWRGQRMTEGPERTIAGVPSTPFRARHPYTTLDQSSADDEPIIRSNDNLQMRLERRSTGATAETWHDMSFAGNHRSSVLGGRAWPPWPFDTSLATTVGINLD